MSATLVRKSRARIGGNVLIIHRYSNGHLWVIMRNPAKITATLVKVHGGYERHREWPRTQPSASTHEPTPPPVTAPLGEGCLKEGTT